MKRRLITAAAFALIAATPLFAASDETEFLQLREKRDEALANAAKPINQQYQTSLQQLLRRAIDDKDKDTAAKIQFELQSLSTGGTASLLPADAAARSVAADPATFQGQLAETKWRLNPDKTFVLHADGTSTSNWTPRRGSWKIIGPNTLELSIWNVARTDQVSIAQGGTLITWQNKEADQLHPLVAKKIASEAGK
jgi:hypothetical protein